MILSAENVLDDFQAASPDLAILPVISGGLSDSVILPILSHDIADELNPLNSYILPVWPYAAAADLSCVCIQNMTLWQVIFNVIASLDAHGIHFTVLIDGMGTIAAPSALPVGNPILKTVVRQLNQEIPTQKTIWLQPLRTARAALLAQNGNSLKDSDLEKAAQQRAAMKASDRDQELWSVIVQSSAGYIRSFRNRINLK